MKVLQTFALPLGHGTRFLYEKKECHKHIPLLFGAGDEARTRYLHLGKVALYRMSYTRISNAGMIIAEYPKKSSVFLKIHGSI